MFKGRFWPRLAAFAGDRRGNVAMIFSLALVPLLAGVGFATDYASGLRQKTIMQNALDAGVLAGAGAVARNDPDPASVVRNYVSGEMATKQAPNPAVTVDVQASGVVTASAQIALPTEFMKFIGIPSTNITVNSQATFGSGNLEVAIVFDTTYSMNGTKLATAQQAASNLVDTLFALPNAASTIKVGLVPFTYYVNVGTSNAGALWLTSTSPNIYQTSYTTCAVPATYSPIRTQQTCYSDGTPYDCSYNAQLTPASMCVTTPGTGMSTWNGCVGSRNDPLDLTDTVAPTDPVPALIGYGCSSPLQRLTTNGALLKSQIQSLYATQETYIAPGLLWGWRVLSPNPPFADGAAYGAAAHKAIVLMTDGANTHSPNYPDHEGTDVNLANKLTDKTCAQIKAAGVTIYTIAFDVTDKQIKKVLQGCATTTIFYYDASTNADLQAAFASVGSQMTALRLSK